MDQDLGITPKVDDPVAEDPVAEDLVAADHKLLRLAELVQHLTDCPPEGAIHAVRRSARTAPTTHDEALSIVARAVVSIHRGVDLRDQLDLP
jgi:hypothetical protein